jgi:hypothetical protein
MHRIHLIGTWHRPWPGQAGQDAVHVLLGEVARLDGCAVHFLKVCVNGQ